MNIQSYKLLFLLVIIASYSCNTSNQSTAQIKSYLGVDTVYYPDDHEIDYSICTIELSPINRDSVILLINKEHFAPPGSSYNIHGSSREYMGLLKKKPANECVKISWDSDTPNTLFCSDLAKKMGNKVSCLNFKADTICIAEISCIKQ